MSNKEQNIRRVRNRLDRRLESRLWPFYRIEWGIERFWSQVKIEGPNDCWEWNGYKTAGGYGRLSGGIFGVRGNVGAHRISFYLHHRCWPLRWVLHTCNNASCVNPAHIYDGSPKDNHRDAVMAHGGEWSRKLTTADVLRIRSFKNIFSAEDIADNTGIHVRTIYRIWANQTYRTVLEPPPKQF